MGTAFWRRSTALSLCLLLASVEAGCGGVTFLGNDFGGTGGSGGAGGSDEDASEPDGTLQDGTAGKDASDEEDGSAPPDGASPDTGDADASLDPDALASLSSAMCAHIAQYPCWETALEQTMQAYAVSSCESWVSAQPPGGSPGGARRSGCDAQWAAWAQCLTKLEPTCSTCAADPEKGPSNCPQGCPLWPDQNCATSPCSTEASALSNCSAGTVRDTLAPGPGATAICEGQDFSADGTCQIGCYLDHGMYQAPSVDCQAEGAAKHCQCITVIGHGVWIVPELAPPGVSGDFYASNCQDATQRAADGACSGLLSCCFQGPEVCDSDGGPCTHDCACVGDPAKYGVSTCAELAQLNDATMLPANDYFAGCQVVRWAQPFLYPSSACLGASSSGLGRAGPSVPLCSAMGERLADCHLYYTAGNSDGTCGPCTVGAQAPSLGPCACEIEQLSGVQGESCRNDVSPVAGDGWCYIDPAQGIGASAQVASCPSDAQRRIRFVGAAAPYGNDNGSWSLHCNTTPSGGSTCPAAP